MSHAAISSMSKPKLRRGRLSGAGVPARETEPGLPAGLPTPRPGFFPPPVALQLGHIIPRKHKVANHRPLGPCLGCQFYSMSFREKSY